jgi:hypothetical protein
MRKISGWAFHIIDHSLNFSYYHKETDAYRRMTEWVERFDEVRVRDSPMISTSSVVKPEDLFVIWIVDRHDGTFRYHYQSKKAVFGGSGGCDTLEEAVERYDRLRGQQPEALTLF